MATIQLRLNKHVGTTYKRALERLHRTREHEIPGDFTLLMRAHARDSWTVGPIQRKADPMRKPRDYDAELKALSDKARQLKVRKVVQLGELVMSTGADGLAPEVLAGVLLDAAAATDAVQTEAWRKRGAAFFCGAIKSARAETGGDQRRAAPDPDGALSLLGEPGAA